MSLRININVADIREKPMFKSPRRAQALYNETIELVKKEGKYSLVRLYDGYKGYVNNLFISDDYQQTGQSFVVCAAISPGYSLPDASSSVATILAFSTETKGVQSHNGFVVCRSARYGEMYLRSEDLILSEKVPSLTSENKFMLIDAAMRFVGVPYLRGGRTFFGMDCSGFVQVLFKYFGIMVPRKTRDQARIGQRVNQEETEIGDLLIFKKHIGIAITKTQYIHSSLSQGGVHVNTLNPREKGYLKNRDLTLRSVRRIIIG